MRKTWCFIVVVLFLWLLPQSAFAHAVLLEANPEPNSVWDESPEQIVLQFNERLDRQLYRLEVRNDRGNVIGKQNAEMSADQRQLSLALPRLGKGVYTVSYLVLSADGHPVSGSYVFSIGEPLPASDASVMSAHAHHHHGDPYGSYDARKVFILTARVWYYFSLLLAAGIVLWRRFLPPALVPKDKYEAYLLFVQRSLMLSWIAVIGFQIPLLADNLDSGQWTDLFTSPLGIIWMVQLALVFGSFVILNRGRTTDLLWVLAVLAVEALYGHAAGADSATASVLADGIHLAAAAVWFGGLFLLVFLYRKMKQERIEFLRHFARAAWISLLALVLTGVALTVLFLPDLNYLTYTQWGKMLIAKVALVGGVLVVGALIRWLIMPRRAEKAGALLALNLGLAAAIVLIAGIFSYMSPLPANKPLHWHVMGAEIHMTAEISPNAPGVNTFKLKVWLPEGDGEPKKLQFLMHPVTDDAETAPLQVPVIPHPDPQHPYDFPGFDRYDYAVDGPYLPYPGKWKLEIRVTDVHDQEWVFEREIQVY